MYLRSHRVQDMLFVECFGKLNADGSLNYELTYWSPNMASYIMDPSVVHLQKQFLKKCIEDCTHEQTKYPNVSLQIEFRRYNDFTFKVQLSSDSTWGNVPPLPRESIGNEKLIGDLLFELTYSMKGKLLLME